MRHISVPPLMALPSVPTGTVVKTHKDIFQGSVWWGMSTQDKEISDHAKIMKQSRATVQRSKLRIFS